MRLAFLALFAVIGTAVSTARAMPPTTRLVDGEVISVSHSKKHMVVKTKHSPDGLIFAWTAQTRFLRQGKFTHAEDLKAGQGVTLRYRQPFLGPRYAGRVFIKTESN